MKLIPHSTISQRMRGQLPKRANDPQSLQESCQKSCQNPFFWIRPTLIASILLMSLGAAESIQAQQGNRLLTPRVDAAAGKVNWKLLFSKMFTANIKRELSNEQKTDMYRAYVTRFNYFPALQNQAIYNTIKKQRSPFEAIQKTTKLFSLPFNATNTNKLFPPKIQHKVQGIDDNTEVKSLVETVYNVSNVSNVSSSGSVNFFKTPAGIHVNKILKDYVLVILPGFAAHTQQMYSFTEIIEDANEFYQRTDSFKEGEFPYHWQRPRTINADKSVTFTPYTKFYVSNRSQSKIGFDVVQAAGLAEIGESLGGNLPIVEKLDEWLKALNNMQQYKNKKFILLGYSKGGMVAHEYLAWAKSNSSTMYRSIPYIITNMATLQGSIAASEGFKVLRDELSLLLNKTIPTNTDAIDEVIRLIDSISSNKDLAQKALGLVASIGSAGIDGPVRDQLKKLGMNPDAFLAAGQQLMTSDTKKIRTLLEGINSMTAYESIKWMMENMNDNKFAGKTIFNISAITNLKDFLLPLGNSQHPQGFDIFGPINPPQLVPQFAFDSATQKTKIDWEKISLDNIFMHLTSLSGFEASPGGLFDTQVGWADTKSIALDQRPLNETLRDDELQQMTQELQLRTPLTENINRSNLFTTKTKNINFIDLADVRGSHWNISFRQSFVPDKSVRSNGSDPYYEHIFPRRAFHASIIESIAVYHLLTAAN